MSLQVDFPQGIQQVRYNEFGFFTLALTNNGVDSAGVESSLNFPNEVFSNTFPFSESGGFDISLRLNPNIVQNCFLVMIVGDPTPVGGGGYSYLVAFPALMSGESINCEIEYHISFKQGNREFEWTALTSGGDTDINTQNNSASHSFLIAPAVVPTLSVYGIILMIIVMNIPAFKRS